MNVVHGICNNVCCVSFIHNLHSSVSTSSYHKPAIPEHGESFSSATKVHHLTRIDFLHHDWIFHYAWLNCVQITYCTYLVQDTSVMYFYCTKLMFYHNNIINLLPIMSIATYKKIRRK